MRFIVRVFFTENEPKPLISTLLSLAREFAIDISMILIASEDCFFVIVSFVSNLINLALVNIFFIEKTSYRVFGILYMILKRIIKINVLYR
jgi:hypothetical protein